MDSPAPRVGSVLEGRWKLEKRLGHGATATVFLAQDLKQRRAVAVKFFSGESCRDPQHLARFEREAALMATLNHPNIAALHAVGRVGVLPYLVMKYVRGVTLSEHRKAKGGRLSPTEMIRVIQPVCAALGFMHEHGLVHRDVKPANILVGAEGQVTLLDLGVARDTAMPALTNPGAMVGTPHYMAPEQIDGRSEVDHRADLYALGALVFELLAGAPPFNSGGELGVVRAHVFDPIPDLAAVADVAAALAQPVSRALAKKPADRFASAAGFLSALEEGCALGYPPTLYGDEESASSTLVDEDEEPQTSPAAMISASPAAPAKANVPARSPPPVPERAPPPVEGEYEGALSTIPSPPFGQDEDEDDEQTTRDSSPGDTLDAPDTLDPAAAPERPSETLMLPEGDEGTGRDHFAGGLGGAGSGFGRVRIVAVQQGSSTWANVLVDGVQAGVSPLLLAVLPGQHLVRLERAGFGSAEQPVLVRAAGQPQAIELELRPAKR